MTSTYSPLLRIQDPATGDQNNTWGTVVNTNFALVEAASTGTSAISVTGLTVYSLTVNNGAADQSRSQVLNFTGTTTADCTVTLPGYTKLGYCVNSTTGGFNIILTTGNGTSTTCPAGYWTQYYCDGINVTVPPPNVPAFQSIGGTFNSLTVTNEITVPSIFTTTLTASGAITAQSVSAQNITVGNSLTTTTGTITTLNAGTVVANNLTVPALATIFNLTSGGTITGTTVNATNSTITTVNANQGNINNLNSTGTITSNLLNATLGTINNINSGGTITSSLLNATTATIYNLSSGGTITSNVFNATTATIFNLSSGGTISSNVFNATSATIYNMNSGGTVNGNVVNAAASTISNANISNLAGNTIGYNSGTMTNLAGTTANIYNISSAGTINYNLLVNNSDYRLKRVFGPSDGGLIDAITVYDVAYLAKPETRYPMVLAHELQAVAPWAVSGTKDEVDESGIMIPQGVDATKLVFALVAKVQSLGARIAVLEGR